MCKEAHAKDENCECGSDRLPISEQDILCSDCINCDEDSGIKVKFSNFKQYYCNRAKNRVICKTECDRHVSRVLTNRREQEKPKHMADTRAFLDRIEALMMCDAFDHIGGTVTLKSSYVHVADIKIHIGPHERSIGHICEHCLTETILVADLVDIDKFYCERCLKHTEPHYNDEV